MILEALNGNIVIFSECMTLHWIKPHIQENGHCAKCSMCGSISSKIASKTYKSTKIPSCNCVPACKALQLAAERCRSQIEICKESKKHKLVF